MPADELRQLVRTDASMRRVRWVGTVFAFVQFLLYRPDANVAIPFSRPLMGGIVAVFILALNLVSSVSSRNRDPALIARMGLLQHVADTTLVLSMVWLFSFDFTSPVWALLVIPVIGGAVRRGLPGALWTWAAVAVVDLARDLFVAHQYSGTTRMVRAEFRLDGLSYRLGIVLIVALAVGYLARNLRTRVAELAAATKESKRRADLLRIVARASRSTILTDLDEALGVVADSVIEVGFDGVEICVLDPRTSTYIASHRRALSASADRKTPVHASIVGLARGVSETVVVDDDSPWTEARREVKRVGFRSVAACPVGAAGTVHTVVVAGSRSRRNLGDDELEALELLAAQAGAALSNARRHEERRRFEEDLQRQAYHDALTGLPNRSLFLARLKQSVIARRRRSRPLAVLLLDLDDFKKINDSLGHDAGDALLKAVAERLRQSVPVENIVARFGGDEFTILIDELPDVSSALGVAEDVLDALREGIAIGGRHVRVGGSVGIAYANNGHRDRDYLREADLAMYRAKDRGGDRWELYRDDMTRRAHRRLSLESELHGAFERSEFRLHYQPMFSLGQKRAVAVEALVRWEHPYRGVIGPGEFLPLAEQTGLMVPLGRWVLDESCRQLSAWQSEAGVDDLAMSVNVSARELRQLEFMERLESALGRHGLEPGHLILEVTEGVVMRDDPAMVKLMKAIERLGVQIAIDDFGLGYSSLQRLRQFHVDVIKIDKSFVSGLPTSDDDRAIVRSVIKLARSLHIAVVAEGVETRNQLGSLKRMGCDIVQGHYLMEATDADSVGGILSSAGVAAFVA